ncbi:hypothetical protein [Mannheimia pernigra]|uniref:Uncharacterized protein n=1 Tax=Mannheimia pernigra TaxID=111844 RepID=A0A7D5IW04_9PAST|nr:hypothetical protein [Mannheimia pernigra]QLB40718.1 hypothetical protein HV559_07460 [Mannheimia pernigra]
MDPFSIFNKIIDSIAESSTQEETNKIVDILANHLKTIKYDKDEIAEQTIQGKLNPEETQKIISQYLKMLIVLHSNYIEYSERRAINSFNFIFYDSPEELAKAISEEQLRNNKHLQLFKLGISNIELYINQLYTQTLAAPTIERKKAGKTPKAKKAEQLLAEEYATDIWGKDHTITQENMAYQLKDKLDLKQSIRTIQNWIKPFQPKP